MDVEALREGIVTFFCGNRFVSGMFRPIRLKPPQSSAAVLIMAQLRVGEQRR